MNRFFKLNQSKFKILVSGICLVLVMISLKSFYNQYLLYREVGDQNGSILQFETQKTDLIEENKRMRELLEAGWDFKKFNSKSNYLSVSSIADSFELKLEIIDEDGMKLSGNFHNQLRLIRELEVIYARNDLNRVEFKTKEDGTNVECTITKI